MANGELQPPAVGMWKSHSLTSGLRASELLAAISPGPSRAYLNGVEVPQSQVREVK